MSAPGIGTHSRRNAREWERIDDGRARERERERERARGRGKRARPSKRQQGGKRVEERKRTKERKENKEGRSDRDGCGSCAALQCDIRRQHTLVASRPFYGTPSANQLSYTRALLRVSFGDSAYGPVLSSPP